jgi:predicted outer membrane repeat protein
LTANTAAAGGGAYVGDNANFIATNCTMSSNTAFVDGGAVYADQNSAVRAEGCTISSNIAAYKGGAVLMNGDSTVTAEHCVVRLNSADRGGAIFTKDRSAVTFSDCVVISNRANVEVLDGILSSVKLVFILCCRSHAVSQCAQGGGIFISSTSGTFISCRILENLAIVSSSVPPPLTAPVVDSLPRH